ncbi:MAG: nicotinate (nicotinamide) nucleotide adenylyltransferase [Planctomycetes bacterium]|nr:nicotinate (nicotinamide) nucleotide adenylyltransferase [Planctomycetota bacterium]
MKIGLLGGSFDPPHNTHIAVAAGMCHFRRLDRVDLLVTGQSPHAEGKSNHADVQHRLAMAHLAVEGRKSLGVEDIETRRKGPSYTIDTIRALKQANPGTSYEFIIGSDMLANLPTWREIGKLLQMVDFVTVVRSAGLSPGVFDDLRAKLGEDETDRLGANVVRIMSLPDISSTQIRAAAAAGESIAEWVPPAVRAYIHAHRLYR